MTTIWGKTQKKGMPARPKNTADRKGETYLGKKLTIKGTISGGDNLQIDGSAEGEFDLKDDLQIGQSARIKGDIRANKIIVGGKVEGTLSALNKIHLENSARVHGNMKTPRLSVEEGAVFNGDMVMNQKNKPVAGSNAILNKPETVDTKPAEKV